MKKFILLLAVSFFCMNCFSAPELFFGVEDIPMIKERINHPDFAYIWEENFGIANEYLNPASKMYCDPEKFIEQWHKAGWYDRMVHSRVEILAFATLITGDRKYADVAVRILELAARSQKTDEEQNVPHRSYAMGLDWCSEYMSAEQKKVITEAAAEFVRLKSQIVFSKDTWWYPYHNWIGVDIGAAGMIALKLRDEYPQQSQQWIRRCNEAIGAWFRNGYDRNGAQVEGTQYYGFGFTNALRYAIAQKRITGVDILAGSEIEKLPNFLAMSLLPGDTEFDARNDSHYGGVDFAESTMFIYAFKSPLMAWLRENTCKTKYSRDFGYPQGTRGYAAQRMLWETDVAPLSPEQLGIKKDQFYEQRGLAIWRTGWEKDDIMYSIEAGKFFPVTHNQADKGHFTLYGMGYRWAPDPGYGNNRTLGGRSQSDGHNLVLVNGKGQSLSGAGVGTNGEMIRWYSDDKYGYALADCTEAYNKTISAENHETSDWWQLVGKDADKDSASLDAVEHAYRHSVYMKPCGDRPAYVVLFDDIKTPQEKNSYTWQMITWPDIKFDTSGEKIVLVPDNKNEDNPRLELYVDAANRSVATDIYTPGDNRKPVSYPRLRVETTEVDNPKFASVLLPLKSGVESPKVNFTRRQNGSVGVVVEWKSGHKETIVCPFEDRFEPVVTMEKPKDKNLIETLNPVRQGKNGERPFWNKYAFTFTFAPAFDFETVDGAAEYVFAAASDSGKVSRFTAERPDANLTPIWLEIPVGQVNLKVVAVDGEGNVIATAGERAFHKGAPYNGPYRNENYDYSDSAKTAMKKLFELDYIRNWLKTGEPDPGYYDAAVGYQYAAKIIGAVIDGAVLYAGITPRPDDADEVLEIGTRAADYLLTRHYPKGFALEDFPPTYDKMETNHHMDVKNAMPMYGTEVGEAYLGLFKLTGSQKYFDAAVKIAEGFKRLQLDNGTWYLMVEAQSGKPVYPNHINPQDVINYLEIFIAEYDRKDFKPVVDKALQWTFENPMKNFNWQNQFEDSVPTDAYKNLTHVQASALAKYLFQKSSDDPQYIEMAKELLRYVEDQFVVWSDPPNLAPRVSGIWPAETYATDKWLFPNVCEQYGFWQPVNASAAGVISTYRAAYIATGDDIYLSKAKDLADTIVYSQEKYHRGQYLTYLTTVERDFWINCAVYTAKVMIEFSVAAN